MKIQVDVEEQLWRKARVHALGAGQTMGELVTLGLKWAVNGSVETKMKEPLASPKVSVASVPTKGELDELAKVAPAKVKTAYCLVCKEPVSEWRMVNGFSVCLPCCKKQGV